MTVIADDKTIEKKDKTADEPVQFYVKGATRPYEIVDFRCDERQGERLSVNAERHGNRSKPSRSRLPPVSLSTLPDDKANWDAR